MKSYFLQANQRGYCGYLALLAGLMDVRFHVYFVEQHDFLGFPYYMLWVGFSSLARALHPLNWEAEHEVFLPAPEPGIPCRAELKMPNYSKKLV